MPALRIAILIDKGARLAPWERKLFNALYTDERFSLCAILTSTARAKRGNPFFRLLMRAEALLFACPPAIDDAAFANALKTMPLLALEEADEARLAALNLDIVLHHASAPPPAGLAQAARSGVWGFDFNAGPADRRALAGFWEAYDGAGVTETSVIAHSPDGGGEIVARAAFNTKFCASRNAAFLKEKSIPLLLRELRRLAAGKAADEKRTAFAPLDRPYPGPLAFLRYAVGVARNLASRLLASAAARLGARPGMWFLRAGKGDILSFDPARGTDVIPPGNSFWADPFLIRENASDYVFFEAYDYRTKRGAIAVGRLDDEGFAYLGEALKTPYHLSFPFLFRHGGALYMIPETVEKKRLEIWRCENFPLQWTLHATAFEGIAAADSVLIEHDGVWWLFTNVSTDSFGDHCSDLYLYRVDGPSLANPVAHALNPVVMDSATGRNGGRVFERAGKLYRTSQNNAFGAYGYGINVMEIETLTLDVYEERVARRVAPDFAPGLIGCHHIDAIGDTSNWRWVLDARKRWGGFPRPSR